MLSLTHWSQWKKYLTTMQIVQFVVDLGLVYFGSKPFGWYEFWICSDHVWAAYQRVAYKYHQGLPYISNCAGSEPAAFFGCFLLTSYLFLFINFYFQTYKKPALKSNNGQANGMNGKPYVGGSRYLYILHWHCISRLRNWVRDCNGHGWPNIPLEYYEWY